MGDGSAVSQRLAISHRLLAICQLVGEHSAVSEAGPEGLVDTAEEIMPARVAIIPVRNRNAVSLRFPGEG